MVDDLVGCKYCIDYVLDWIHMGKLFFTDHATEKKDISSFRFGIYKQGGAT